MTTETRHRKFNLCPYLGQHSDPETAYSFPSHWNYCTHSKSANPIALIHQEEFCLTSRHSNCIEFRKDTLGMHEEATPQNLWKKLTRKPWVLAGSILVLVLLVSLAWILIAHSLQREVNSIIPTSATVLQVTNPQSTSTVVIPKLTRSPVPTKTLAEAPMLIRGLETPLGVEHRFIIHQIQAGDSLELIASRYGTSVEALLACNHTLPIPLLSGWTIVAPLDNPDATGLPSFDIYGVTVSLSTEELAERLAVDLESFRYYNDLPEGQILYPGEWVLAPRGEIPTP